MSDILTVLDTPLEDRPVDSKATERALLNATSDLALIIDPDGTILEISDATATRIDKHPNNLLGASIYDFLKPEMVDFRKAYVSMVTQSRQQIRFEDQYEDTKLLVCIYPIMDKNDDVVKLAIFVSDTTQLKENEMLLHRYSQILSTINDPIAYIDKKFTYRTVNEATLKIYEKNRDRMIGKPVAAIVGNEVFEEKFKPHIEKCLEGEKVYYQDWFEYPDGGRRYMYMSYYPLFAKDNVVSGVVVNATDVTKMKEIEDQLKRLSQTDQLTQIFNRVKFHDALAHEINRIRRYESELALVMFDIDHFKSINDTHGHDVGDDVLVDLTKKVQTLIRETDIFARWGGEEFMLLLPHTSFQNAATLAERIRSAIEKHEFPTVKRVTCSFGVTHFIKTDDGETFTKRADQALYKAKEGGRNRVIAARAK